MTTLVQRPIAYCLILRRLVNTSPVIVKRSPIMTTIDGLSPVLGRESAFFTVSSTGNVAVGATVVVVVAVGETVVVVVAVGATVVVVVAVGETVVVVVAVES